VKCPFLLGNSINTFVTYDDPVSIGHKAQYVMDNDIGGVIIWEITGDYIETNPGSGIIADTPLLDTLNFIFETTTALHHQIHAKAFTYPNPATTHLFIESKDVTSSNMQIELYGSTGKLIHNPVCEYNAGGISINLQTLTPGLYIYCLTDKYTGFKYIGKFIKVAE